MLFCTTGRFMSEQNVDASSDKSHAYMKAAEDTIVSREDLKKYGHCLTDVVIDGECVQIIFEVVSGQ
jgi:hypothetical protein